MNEKQRLSLGLVLRNGLYWLVTVVTTFICLLLMVLAPVPIKKRYKIGVLWAQVLLWALQNIVGLRYRVIGQENILAQPCVICAKHQSGWEIFALFHLFPQQVFVAKRELLWIPFFGLGLYLMHSILINRTNPKQANRQLLEQGLERKKNGFSITIFPEGTRVPPGKIGKYKLGAAKMAIAFDMPITPVAHNAGLFWPRNSFWKYPGEITLVIGPALFPAAETSESLMAKVRDWIETQQSRLSELTPGGS